MRFLLPFCLSVLAISAKPLLACELFTARPTELSVKAFDPDVQLKQHGVDPRKISIQIGEDEFALVYDDKELIGLLSYSFYMTDDWWDINTVKVKDFYRGKGLGLLIYLFAAKHVYDHTGRVLKRSSDTSSSSRKLWNDLVGHGYADTFPESRMTYLREAILQDKTLADLKKFASDKAFDKYDFAHDYEELHQVAYLN